MEIHTILPEDCREAVLSEGSALREQAGFLFRRPVVLADGRLQLQAKVQDSFHFVDHPRVELDAAGEAVQSYRCDCPDYRLNRRFCAHCVAVVLAFEAEFSALRDDEPEIKGSGEQTDFLKGAQEDAVAPVVTDFSYAFCNSPEDLYPGKKGEIRIPLARYKQAFGDNELALENYDILGAWGGSCFGMVATASMLQHAEKDTCVSDFSETAGIPSELRLTDYNPAVNLTLHQFIEMLHILQLHDAVLEEMHSITGLRCVEAMAKRVEAFQRGEALPVLMGITGDIGGHEVLPYRLEHTSPTEDVLHIYDPNWPLETRYAYLEKDEDDNYLNWRFPMSDDCVFSGENGDKIDMTCYETYQEVWNNRGGSAVRNKLKVNPGVVVKDMNGVLLARVTEKGVESFRDDIYEIRVRGGLRNGTGVISLPAGSYICCLEDACQEELSVRMTGLDLRVEITTAAREAMIQVEDENVLASARIAEPNARYTIEIHNSFGKDFEQVTLHGVTATEPLHLVQKEGRLYARGLTARAALYIDDERMPLSRISELVQEPELREEDRELLHNTVKETDEET